MALSLTGPAGTFILPEGESLIGRGDDCLVRIKDARLSRHHARLVLAGGQLTVHDLGSSNGVLVNGDRIRVPTVVPPGAMLVCGPLALRLVSDGGDLPAAPAPAMPKAHSSDQRTEAMDPLEIQRALEEAQARRPGRVDPAIAAAIADSGSFKAATDIHPSDQLPVTSTSALSPNRFHDPPQVPQPRRTTGILPQDAQPSGSGALEPSEAPSSPSLVRLRVRAGLADAGGWLAFAVVCGGLWAMGGALIATIQAGAGIAGDGLPLVSAGVPAAGPAQLAAAIAKGLVGGGSLTRSMYGVAPLPSFLVLLAAWGGGVALVLGILAAGLVLPTVRGPGPFAHHRLGLHIVVAATGRPPGVIRATVRWLVLLATAPLALVTAALGGRGLHDLLTGCRVR